MYYKDYGIKNIFCKEYVFPSISLWRNLNDFDTSVQQTSDGGYEVSGKGKEGLWLAPDFNAFDENPNLLQMIIGWFRTIRICLLNTQLLFISCLLLVM